MRNTPLSLFTDEMPICVKCYFFVYLGLLVSQLVKNLPAMWETWVRSLGWEEPLEEGMATPSSTLAWKIPWAEKPGRLQSTGSQRARYVCVCVCVCVCVSCFIVSNSLQPIDCIPPSPSLHGILQVRTLEWVAISFSKRNYRRKESKVAQVYPTLCDPIDCSLPGSFIYGIFQARVLE